MPQSMLGLLALTLATLISFNQQRLRQESYKSTIRDEIELAAAGTSQHVLEMISARSFDEFSTPRRIFDAGVVPNGASTFTGGGSSEFGRHNGPGECDLMEPYLTPDCDDVDDLDGIRGAPIYATLSDGRVMQFSADVDVTYVTDTEAQTETNTPTLHKRVDLTVHSLNPVAPVSGLITLSRVISYDPVRADANMEADCGPIGMNPVCTPPPPPPPPPPGSGTVS